MVEILRNKWCEDLEDLLQCPICMICPINAYIYQCTQGHHICHVCKPQVGPLCPTCGNNWTAYRNRLAENMCSKFDDIKSSLIDPDAEINKLLIADKFCIGTQTDSVEGATVEAVGATVEAAVVTALSPAEQIAEGHNGLYPCCIGFCKTNLCFEPLMQHIQSMHSSHFSEIALGQDLLFEHSWCFSYTANYILERAFRIREVGTFILKLSTDKCGDFCGYIMMIHSGFFSKLFSYRLKLSESSGHSFPTFTGNVNSCRSPATVFQTQCLRVKSDDIVKMMNEHSKMLTCTLFLAKKLQLDEAQLKTNGQNKRRGRNRNKTAKTQATNISSAAMPGA